MNNQLLSLTIAAVCSLWSLPAIAQERGAPARPAGPAAAPKPVPRAPDGKPALLGYWNSQNTSTQILEEHPAGFQLRAGKSMIVDPSDGKIPYQPWTLAERDRRRRPENNYLDPDVHCMPSGTPRAMYDMSTPILMLQPAGHIVMLHEISHSYRIIPIDGRPHLPATFRPFAGDSIGRWEGDTLVIDTINNSGQQWLGQYGDFIDAGAHVIERLTMVNADTITYRATIEDPKMFTRPWTIGFELARNPDPKFEILEVACHEEDLDRDILKTIHEVATGKAQ